MRLHNSVNVLKAIESYTLNVNGIICELHPKEAVKEKKKSMQNVMWVQTVPILSKKIYISVERNNLSWEMILMCVCSPA